MPRRSRYSVPESTEIPLGGSRVHRTYTIIRPFREGVFYIVKDKTNIATAKTEDEARAIIDSLFPSKNRGTMKAKPNRITARGRRRNRGPRGKAESVSLGGFETHAITVRKEGGFVQKIFYEDARDRESYYHDFRDLGAILYLCDSAVFGKCVLIVSADDLPLWENA